MITLLLIGIAIFCAYTDIRYRKIENYIVFPMMALGIIYNGFYYGVEGVKLSLFSIVLIFVLFVIPFHLQVIGAGDIKYLMGLASFYGSSYATSVLFIGSIFGAIYAIYLIIKHYIIYKKEDIPFSWKEFWKKLQVVEIPYGVFISIGVLLITLLNIT